MTIACVILNYNDAETTERLVSEIRGYACFSRILLVDNASTDDSLVRLNRLRGGNVEVLAAEKNGGYGAGNNLGVRYAVERCGATHVLIANPDVSFSEACVRKLARIFRNHPRVGVAAARMEDPGFGPFPNGWRLHGLIGELLFMGPVSRRLWKPLLYYPASYLRGKKAVSVGAVHGSMLMTAGEAFLACGGYDESIFLYQEEMVLGQRMKAAGYGSVLLLTDSYRHLHSVSISKSIQDEMARQSLREQSVLYYLEHYLGAGALGKGLARAWFLGIRLEVRIFRGLRAGYHALRKMRKAPAGS